MKSKKSTVKIAALMIIAVFIPIIITGCKSENDNRNIVYEDMKTAFEKSGMLSANIGLFSKTETDSQTSYANGGSGVIFDKRDGASGILYAFSSSPTFLSCKSASFFA